MESFVTILELLAVLLVLGGGMVLFIGRLKSRSKSGESTYFVTDFKVAKDSGEHEYNFFRDKYFVGDNLAENQREEEKREEERKQFRIMKDELVKSKEYKLISYFVKKYDDPTAEEIERLLGLLLQKGHKFDRIGLEKILEEESLPKIPKSEDIFAPVEL